jgi:hypothetical protein
MFNLLKADILSLFIAEIGIVMIILSCTLKYRLNRWVNLIVSPFYIAIIVGGVPYPYYMFIATVEAICLLLIIWNAWTWNAAE